MAYLFFALKWPGLLSEKTHPFNYVHKYNAHPLIVGNSQKRPYVMIAQYKANKKVCIIIIILHFFSGKSFSLYGKHLQKWHLSNHFSR